MRCRPVQAVAVSRASAADVVHHVSASAACASPSVRRAVRSAGPNGRRTNAGIRGARGEPLLRVIYEGIDPIVGDHRTRATTLAPACTDRDNAERLTADLARRRPASGYERSSFSVALFVTQRWVRSRWLTLRASTYDSRPQPRRPHHAGNRAGGRSAPMTSNGSTELTDNATSAIARTESGCRPATGALCAQR